MPGRWPPRRGRAVFPTCEEPLGRLLARQMPYPLRGKRERGLEPTGRNGIAGYPMFAQLGSKRASKAGETALGRRYA